MRIVLVVILLVLKTSMSRLNNCLEAVEEFKISVQMSSAIARNKHNRLHRRQGTFF